jgi:hypothetical protein
VRNIKYFNCSKFRTRRHTCPKLVEIYGHLQIHCFPWVGTSTSSHLLQSGLQAGKNYRLHNCLSANTTRVSFDDFEMAYAPGLAPGLALSYPEYLHTFSPRTGPSSGGTVSFGPGISRSHTVRIYSQHNRLQSNSHTSRAYFHRCQKL